MEFRFYKEAECINVKLEEIAGNSVVDIEFLKFSKSSKENIEDILNSQMVTGKNQNLIIEHILISKENFTKLRNDCRYTAYFETLIKADGDKVAGAKFILNNIDLEFDRRNVNYDDSEENIINYANMLVYPYGKNEFKIIE